MRLTRDQLKTHYYKNLSNVKEDNCERLEIVTFEFEDGKPGVLVWMGKQAKPIHYYKFSTVEKQMAHVQKVVESEVKEMEAKKTLAEKKKAAVCPFKVGDILTGSWGYDQTNVDFWQVTKLIGKSMAEVRPIGSIDASSENEAPMTEHVVPYADHFIGPARRVRISNSGFNPESFIHARLWDGKPCYASHYA